MSMPPEVPERLAILPHLGIVEEIAASRSYIYVPSIWPAPKCEGQADAEGDCIAVNGESVFIAKGCVISRKTQLLVSIWRKKGN